MRVLVSLLCGLLIASPRAFAVDPASTPPASAKPADAAAAKDPAAAPVAKEAPPADEPAATTAPTATAAPEDTGLPGREGELVPRLPELAGDEELVWLNAAGTRFFAFRRPPAKGQTPRGALLIVPDPRAFIDQQAVTRALREIPARGAWLTLALQVPLAEVPSAAPVATPSPSASPPPDTPPTEPTPAATPAPDPAAATPVPAASEAAPDPLCGRIAAALALLESTSPPLVALVAQDENAARALACYPEGLPPGVGAFATIGRWAGKLGGLKLPSIEFVASLDPVARREATRRVEAPREPGAPPHRMVEIDAASRQFGGAEQDLAKRLRGWLERLPVPPAPADKPAKVSS